MIFSKFLSCHTVIHSQFSTGKDTKGCLTVVSVSYYLSVIAKCSIILVIQRPASSGSVVVCVAHVEQFSDTFISSLPQITQVNKSSFNDLLLCKWREESKSNTIPCPIHRINWWLNKQHCSPRMIKLISTLFSPLRCPWGTGFHLAPHTPSPFL